MLPYTQRTTLTGQSFLCSSWVLGRPPCFSPAFIHIFPRSYPAQREHICIIKYSMILSLQRASVPTALPDSGLVGNAATWFAKLSSIKLCFTATFMTHRCPRRTWQRAKQPLFLTTSHAFTLLFGPGVAPPIQNVHFLSSAASKPFIQLDPKPRSNVESSCSLILCERKQSLPRRLSNAFINPMSSLF